jgi:3-oxoacyl-[acyl-carrier protein] reductase
MTITFEGQVVLVTGATRGIGQEIAWQFAERGATLILTGTKEGAAGISGIPAGRQTYHAVDFSDARSTAQFLRALERYERIDVCVNNAGINRINQVEDVGERDWDDILNVNLKAPFLVTKAVARTMKQRGYGRIVNIASVFGVVSRERRSAYSASKFGLRGLTVAVSNELARHNVLVNAVSPGFILTDLTRRILSEQEIADLARHIPMGRLGQPEEIASVVLFLASGLNTYLTGQNIVVDGGYVNV